MWDDPSAHSLLWLHNTGFVLGVLFPRRIREISAGAFAGQVLWFFTLGPMPISLHPAVLVIVGWISMLAAALTLACTMGAIVGAAIRLLSQRRAGLRQINSVIARMRAWPG